MIILIIVSVIALLGVLSCVVDNDYKKRNVCNICNGSGCGIDMHGDPCDCWNCNGSGKYFNSGNKRKDKVDSLLENL